MTSARTGDGIQALFNSIGSKLVDPNYKDKDGAQKKDEANRESLKLDKNDFKEENIKKKKKCC